MTMEVDDDIKAVAEFMQERIEASRLVSVAEGLAAVAPLLWGRHPRKEVAVIQLSSVDPISNCGQHTRSFAI